jgi:ketosteroid isomerase-like protein
VKTAETSVLRLLETYKAAVFARNVDDFMNLYDPNARVFDTWGVWSYESAADRRQAIEGWFGSLGDERVKVTFTEVRVSGEHDLMLVNAVCEYVGCSAEGEELRSMQNRFTWAIARNGDTLKVVHEHTSVPISPKDTKAIFHRTDPN